MRGKDIDKALECMHDVAFVKGQYDQAQREIDRLQGLVDRLTGEAQIWANEARAANASLNECYRAVTGGRGEPGNWNGARPVERHLSWLTKRIEMLESVLGERDEEIKRLKGRDQ